MVLDKAKYHDEGIELQGGGGSSHTHIVAFTIWSFHKGILKNDEYVSKLNKPGPNFSKMIDDGYFDYLDSDWFKLDQKVMKKLYDKYLGAYGKVVGEAFPKKFYVDYDEAVQKLANNALDEIYARIDKKPFWAFWIKQ